jgi:RNA polymerase sigma-70 factor (ECF subfamily)
MAVTVNKANQDSSDGGDRTGRAELGGEDLAASRLVSQAVRRAQSGDREALGFLYARYSENIYGYVRSIVQDHHEAEDVTQQVFAKLVHVISKYQEREVPFFAWMLRVARNVAIDHLRGARLVPVEEVMAVDQAGDLHTSGRRINDLKDALAELPHDQREVLVLRHFAGFSPTEIATRMERSEGSVHGLHHRGRRALKAELTRRGVAPSTAESARLGALLDPALVDPGQAGRPSFGLRDIDAQGAPG